MAQIPWDMGRNPYKELLTNRYLKEGTEQIRLGNEAKQKELDNWDTTYAVEMGSKQAKAESDRATAMSTMMKNGDAMAQINRDMQVAAQEAYARNQDPAEATDAMRDVMRQRGAPEESLAGLVFDPEESMQMLQESEAILNAKEKKGPLLQALMERERIEQMHGKDSEEYAAAAEKFQYVAYGPPVWMTDPANEGDKGVYVRRGTQEYHEAVNRGLRPRNPQSSARTETVNYDGGVYGDGAGTGSDREARQLKESMRITGGAMQMLGSSLTDLSALKPGAYGLTGVATEWLAKTVGQLPGGDKAESSLIKMVTGVSSDEFYAARQTAQLLAQGVMLPIITMETGRYTDKEREMAIERVGEIKASATPAEIGAKLSELMEMVWNQYMSLSEQYNGNEIDWNNKTEFDAAGFMLMKTGAYSHLPDEQRRKKILRALTERQNWSEIRRTMRGLTGQNDGG